MIPGLSKFQEDEGPPHVYGLGVSLQNMEGVQIGSYPTPPISDRTQFRYCNLYHSGEVAVLGSGAGRSLVFIPGRV